MTADELLRQQEIEGRLRRLEALEDDREALRRRLEMALARAEAAEREVEQLRREIAHLRHRDDHMPLMFGGGHLGVDGG